MSVRANNGDFVKDQWHKLAALGGVAALVAVIVFKFVLVSEDDAMDFGGAPKPAGKVAEFDIAPFKSIFGSAGTPASMAAVPDDAKSFLASELRVSCATPEGSSKDGCGMPIPFTDKECRFCRVKQDKEIKVILDTDGDGLLDEFEKLHGLDPVVADADADKDGDGFTNIEEFVAKTSPSDPKSHPDYIDSLNLMLPLEQEYTQLKFVRSEKIHGKLRFHFKLPGRENEEGHGNYYVYENAEIGDTGFVVKSFEAKTRKIRKVGMEMDISVQADEVTVQRKRDGKRIVLVLEKSPTPTDVRAKIVCPRAGNLEFKVATGEEIKVNGTPFKVLEIKKAGSVATVTIKNIETGKVRTIEALEQ